MSPMGLESPHESQQVKGKCACVQLRVPLGAPAPPHPGRPPEVPGPTQTWVGLSFAELMPHPKARDLGGREGRAVNPKQSCGEEPHVQTSCHLPRPPLTTPATPPVTSIICYSQLKGN